MDSPSSPRRPDDDVVIINNRADVDVDVKVEHQHGHDVITVDIVDIEECGRENRPPPPAHRYKVRIDHDKYVFDQRFVTARQLLERAGKTPVDRYELEKRVYGGHYVSLELDDKTDLGECGIEVFESFPLDEKEG